MKIKVEFKKLYQDSKLPKKAHDTDAGFDLHAYTANEFLGGVVDIWPNQRVLVKTGFALSIPVGFEGQVRPRSGLALKNGITIVNSPGTIDAGFFSEVGVILLNTSTELFRILHGDRIAQLVIQKLPEIEVVEVQEFSTQSERNLNGFGSTGV